MAKATRSVVIPLGKLQYAFDSENLRAHTVWLGKLDLYGPQYAHSKRPFIAQVNGDILMENPPTLPWRLTDPTVEFQLNPTSITGQFKGTSLRGNTASLHYQLTLPDHAPVDITIQPSASDHGFRRAITVSRCDRPLWFLVSCTPENAKKHPLGLVTDHSTISTVETIAHLNYEELNITEAGAESVFDTTKVDHSAKLRWVKIPAHKKSLSFSVITVFPGYLNDSTEKKPAVDVGGKARFASQSPGRHPFYRTEQLPLQDDWNLLVTGMDWLEDGRLAVSTWPGEIYLLSGLLDKKDVLVRRLLTGLNEPMGLLVRDGKLYVSQKPELTEITFDEANGSIAFKRISADWGYSGHYNAFSYGPVLDRDNRFVLANAGHSGRWDMKFMGWGIRQSGAGKMQGVSSGFREPNGIDTFGPDRDIFVTDNQGHWTAVCELNHLRPGKYFGRPSAIPDPKNLYKGRPDFSPPAIWFPYTLARSISGMAEITGDRFGPFKSQLLVGDFQNALVTRVFLEKVNGEYQGAVFPFLKGFRSGVNRLSFGPDGNLYVGGLQRTWACVAPDPASFERVTFKGNTPFSISKVKAKPDGFLLTFTKPARPSSADPDNFDVSQFRYAYHAGYGSPRYNFQGEKNSQTPLDVIKATLSVDGMSLHLAIEGLKERHVTEFRCYDIVDEGGSNLWHDTFHYTLNEIPKP